MEPQCFPHEGSLTGGGIPPALFLSGINGRGKTAKSPAIFGKRAPHEGGTFSNPLKARCFLMPGRKNAIFLQISLGVRSCEAYTRRHPVTGKPERPRPQDRSGLGEAVFHFQTFRGAGAGRNASSSGTTSRLGFACWLCCNACVINSFRKETHHVHHILRQLCQQQFGCFVSIHRFSNAM